MCNISMIHKLFHLKPDYVTFAEQRNRDHKGQLMNNGEC